MNSHGTPTAAFVKSADWQAPTAGCEAALVGAVGRSQLGVLGRRAGGGAAAGRFSIYTNPLMLGYAWQQGRVPLGHASLMRAIELNGTQVENNQAAFEWGRRCAHDLASVQALFKAAQVIQFVKKPSVDDMVGKRRGLSHRLPGRGLCAASTRPLWPRCAQAESALDSTRLTEAVARYLFKLMAYKDEYEVARLHTDVAFTAKIAGMFEGELGKDYKLVHHLAPPILGKRNAKGEPVKQAFGPWMRSAFGCWPS
jgi:indolepyruvate ferredoxin oxidoreductase